MIKINFLNEEFPFFGSQNDYLPINSAAFLTQAMKKETATPF
jgi:hypothetical protein